MPQHPHPNHPKKQFQTNQPKGLALSHPDQAYWPRSKAGELGEFAKDQNHTQDMPLLTTYQPHVPTTDQIHLASSCLLAQDVPSHLEDYRHNLVQKLDKSQHFEKL